ncbi:MAG: hypothetical protein E7517_04420 [Ruminococcaceae bacterium]|nr:hypothetical protein [Oscillospiraceae bacterium]
MKNKTKQLIAVVALAAFVLFTVFGAVGLVISSHHHCEGVHCQTCERIAVVKNVVNMIKAGVVVLCFILCAHRLMRLFAEKMPLKIIYTTTVRLKTKLNN